MTALGTLITMVTSLLTMVIWAYVIISFLFHFGVLNQLNPTVRAIWNGLEQMADKLLGPIRKFLPPVNGLDFSPIIFLIGLEVLKVFLLKDVLGT